MKPQTIDRLLPGTIAALILYAAGCLVALAWSLRHSFDEDSRRRP